MRAPGVGDHLGWQGALVIRADHPGRRGGEGEVDAGLEPLPAGRLQRVPAGPDRFADDAYPVVAVAALLHVPMAGGHGAAGRVVPPDRVDELHVVRRRAQFAAQHLGVLVGGDREHRFGPVQAAADERQDGGQELLGVPVEQGLVDQRRSGGCAHAPSFSAKVSPGVVITPSGSDRPAKT
jgi:hypothetical protein